MPLDHLAGAELENAAGALGKMLGALLRQQDAREQLGGLAGLRTETHRRLTKVYYDAMFRASAGEAAALAGAVALIVALAASAKLPFVACGAILLAAGLACTRLYNKVMDKTAQSLAELDGEILARGEALIRNHPRLVRESRQLVEEFRCPSPANSSRGESAPKNRAAA